MKSAKNTNSCKPLSFLSNNMRSNKNPLELLIEGVLGVLTIVSFTIFVLINIPVYLFRLIVISYVKYFREDLDEILNGTSAFLVNDYFDNKTPRANVVVHIIVKGHVALDEIKDLVTRHWIKTNDNRFKQFCQYPVRWMGFTFYKKTATSFNINNHVHLFSKKEQGIDGYVTEADITRFSEKLLNAPYPPFTSPWEIHLVQNYKNGQICSEPEELSVFIFKAHHSLTDGFSLMAAFAQAFSQQTLADLKIPKPKYPRKSLWKTLISFVVLLTKSVVECGHYVSQVWRSCPWKIPDAKKNWYQLSMRSDFIPIQKVHKIRKAFGVSFSSVVYTAVSAAIYKSWQDSKDNRLKIQKSMLKSAKKSKEDSSIFCLHVIPLPGHPMSLTNHV